MVGALSLLAFGLHIPDLSTQSRLVTNESVPNLIGLAVGAGGESETLHHLMTAALAIAVLACCWTAWRPRRSDPERGAAERTITASRLGERRAAGDAQLGAALVRPVGAAAGRAVDAHGGCASPRSCWAST